MSVNCLLVSFIRIILGFLLVEARRAKLEFGILKRIRKSINTFHLSSSPALISLMTASRKFLTSLRLRRWSQKRKRSPKRKTRRAKNND